MTDSATGTAQTALLDAARALHAAGRTDLAERLSVAAARIDRPSCVVCVVGEFKQGKSSLVNALVADDLCPVDDDLATSAITIVRWGEARAARVHRRAGVTDGNAAGASAVEHIDVDDLMTWVSESGNPGNEKQVERVEVVAPIRFLETGLVLVDTPGMGGLGAGHAAATLGFLPFADGLVFVSDASSELSAPELDFLQRSVALCPNVMFAQTKIDLYPEWQRIVDINRAHLERAGLDLPVVGVSSAVRTEALRRGDRSLNERSRLPELVRHLNRDVVAPAKATAVERSIGEARDALGHVGDGFRAELAMLRDPSTAAAAVQRLDEATQRIEHLRGPGSRWSMVVGDRITDLASEVGHRFRSDMRAISRAMDERIEQLTKGSQWDEMVRELQAQVADAVTRSFVDLEIGRGTIRQEVVALLRDEQLEGGEGGAAPLPFDVAEIWRERELEVRKGAGKRAFTTAVTGVRGAQGGIIMFGTLGTFLPAAAGMLLASNPVLLGVGALFGVTSLADDRKRKVSARRQAARSQMRQFVDDVQFEVGNQTNGLVRDIQRDLRDEFSTRLTELLRTCSETATRAKEDVQRSAADREQRGKQLDVTIARFDDLLASLDVLAVSE